MPQVENKKDAIHRVKSQLELVDANKRKLAIEAQKRQSDHAMADEMLASLQDEETTLKKSLEYLKRPGIVNSNITDMTSASSSSSSSSSIVSAVYFEMLSSTSHENETPIITSTNPVSPGSLERAADQDDDSGDDDSGDDDSGDEEPVIEQVD